MITLGLIPFFCAICVAAEVTAKGTINDTAFEIVTKTEGDKITVDSKLENAPKERARVILIEGALRSSPPGTTAGDAINSTSTNEGNSSSESTSTYAYRLLDGRTMINDNK